MQDPNLSDEGADLHFGPIARGVNSTGLAQGTEGFGLCNDSFAREPYSRIICNRLDRPTELASEDIGTLAQHLGRGRIHTPRCAESCNFLSQLGEDVIPRTHRDIERAASLPERNVVERIR